MTSLRRTPLYHNHVAAGARIVPFAGWEMPLSFGGILDEHKAVRTKAGIFDVSHMGRFRLRGSRAGELLDYLVTGRASVLPDGRLLYTLILNQRGGVLDDLLVGRHGDSFLIVVNAANLEADFDHFAQACNDFTGTELEDETEKIALLALQGPRSRSLLEELLGVKLEGLEYYWMADFRFPGETLTVSRTGYTGELGYEIFVESRNASRLWERLVNLPGVTPCGLGCRDTLRLEMGYRLYGHELDASHTPFEAGLSWAVDMEKKDFSGKGALVEQKAGGVQVLLRGVEASARDIPRSGYRLAAGGKEVGRLASGGIAPSLGIGIGTAYMPLEFATPGTKLELDLRGRLAPVTVVKLPFYKKGTARD
ncbi:MAG TPA: glycine cleavage system aminomethyltransferase GcvT [archaeon]|nr:glycine cleavage system aminomethyltransferase GcvT [archaeon]